MINNISEMELQELNNTYNELSEFVTKLITENNKDYKMYDNLRIYYYNLLRKLDETI